MSLSNAFPMALAAFALFTACQTVATENFAPLEQSQLESELESPPVPHASGSENENVVAGGFAPGDPSEPGARIAYDMVERAIYERYPTRALIDVVTLETQVVAGLNYRFRVEMTGAATSRAIYQGVVYRNLSDTYELTSLEKLQ